MPPGSHPSLSASVPSSRRSTTSAPRRPSSCSGTPWGGGSRSGSSRPLRRTYPLVGRGALGADRMCTRDGCRSGVPSSPGGLLPAPSLGAVGPRVQVAGGALVQAVDAGRGLGRRAAPPGVARLSPDLQPDRPQRLREADAPCGTGTLGHARDGGATPLVRRLLRLGNARGVALRWQSAHQHVHDPGPEVQSRACSPLLGSSPSGQTATWRRLRSGGRTRRCS